MSLIISTNTILKEAVFKTNPFKKDFHSTCIRLSDPNDLNIQTILENEGNTRLVRGNNESQWQLVKYDKLQQNSTTEGVNTSEYSESFPWFIDKDGNLINYNDSVSLFDAVSLINNYLIKRFKIDQESADLKLEGNLNEYLLLYKDQKEVRVLDLYNHAKKVYSDSETKNIIKNNLLENSTDSNLPLNESKTVESRKLFGTYGDNTLNEVADQLLNKEWENIVVEAQTVFKEEIPLGVNVYTFNRILTVYLDKVYNRDYPSYFTPAQRLAERNIRNIHLGIFTVLGIPLAMYALRKSSLNIIDRIFAHNQDTSIIKQNSILLIITKFLKNTSNRLKIFVFLFTLVVLTIIIDNFGPEKLILFISTPEYIKIYLYVVGSLALAYNLLSLYFLNLYSKNKKLKISQIWPNFIFIWLNNLELFSKKKDINYAKHSFYIHMVIYITILVLGTIFL